MNLAIAKLLILVNLFLPGAIPQGFIYSGTVTAPAIALITHTSTQTTSGSVDTTGANFLVCSAWNNGTPSAPSDAKANTWQALTLVSNVGQGIYEQLFYVYSATVGSGETFTNNGNTSYGGVACAAFSNTLASSGVLDAQSPSGGTVCGAGATSCQPGAITPGAINELFFTGIYSGSGGTLSIDTSFTITDQGAAGGGSTFGAAYLVYSGSSATNPTWSGLNSGYDGTAMAAFRHP